MISTKDTSVSDDKDRRNDVLVMDALQAASALYERYVAIVEVANIAAFQQALPPVNPQTIAPLGLVIWPEQ